MSLNSGLRMRNVPTMGDRTRSILEGEMPSPVFARSIFGNDVDHELRFVTPNLNRLHHANGLKAHLS